MPTPWLWLASLVVCAGAFSFAHSGESDEQVIRKMVLDAVNRMNGGDTSTFREFWDVDADYVSVDGRLIKGRAAMEEFLIPMIAGASKITQHATNRARSLLNAGDAAGKELPPLRGRGVEVAQRKDGRWLLSRRAKW